MLPTQPLAPQGQWKSVWPTHVPHRDGRTPRPWPGHALEDHRDRGSVGGLVGVCPTRHRIGWASRCCPPNPRPLRDDRSRYCHPTPRPLKDGGTRCGPPTYRTGTVGHLMPWPGSRALRDSTRPPAMGNWVATQPWSRVNPLPTSQPGTQSRVGDTQAHLVPAGAGSVPAGHCDPPQQVTGLGGQQAQAHPTRRRVGGTDKPTDQNKPAHPAGHEANGHRRHTPHRDRPHAPQKGLHRPTPCRRERATSPPVAGDPPQRVTGSGGQQAQAHPTRRRVGGTNKPTDPTKTNPHTLNRAGFRGDSATWFLPR